MLVIARFCPVDGSNAKLTPPPSPTPDMVVVNVVPEGKFAVRPSEAEGWVGYDTEIDTVVAHANEAEIAIMAISGIIFFIIFFWVGVLF